MAKTKKKLQSSTDDVSLETLFLTTIKLSQYEMAKKLNSINGPTYSANKIQPILSCCIDASTELTN